MHLLNSSNEIPKQFYVFLDRGNFISQKNLEESKCIFSSGFLQAVEETDKVFVKSNLPRIISFCNPKLSNQVNFKENFLKGSVDYLPYVENIRKIVYTSFKEM